MNALQTPKMKTKLVITALTMFAANAFAGFYVPYISMPTGGGYATDAHGQRHPNAYCVRDAVRAIVPEYPLGSAGSADWENIKWDQVESSGLYRLDIDLTTGRVTKVTIVKSGTKELNELSVAAFKLWVFKPGKWKEIILPTTMRKKWMAIGLRNGTTP
jgi:hypothetical protein